MTTAVARVPKPADAPAVPQRKSHPGFGLYSVLQHFWHPHRYEDGESEWPDEFATTGLTVSGDASITRLYVPGFEIPYVRLTETAAFAEGTNMTAAETGTLFCVARINTADDVVTNGTIINNGRSSIQMNTEGSTTVSLTDGTPSTTASLNQWHQFTLTTPADTLRTRFTIDDRAFTATNVSAGASRSVRVGTSVPSKREMDVLAVWTTTPLAAATITDDVFPLVKEWWPELEWAV